LGGGGGGADSSDSSLELENLIVNSVELALPRITAQRYVIRSRSKSCPIKKSSNFEGPLGKSRGPTGRNPKMADEI